MVADRDPGGGVSRGGVFWTGFFRGAIGCRALGREFVRWHRFRPSVVRGGFGHGWVVVPGRGRGWVRGGHCQGVTHLARCGPPGWIGVHVKGVLDPVSGSHVVIDEVMPDAPAAKAGLLSGDVLLQLGDRKIAQPEDVLDAIFYITAEDDLPIRVARDGAEVQVHVTPADPPDAEHPKALPPLPPLAPPPEATPSALKIEGR